ncbi:MAG: D-alanine--D-alanine ligase [Magnetococcales bacterium]|nr:D-alanine--D-alanine ligase [Magnetococcales bacterium]
MDWRNARIGVLMGGLSEERPVSLKSGTAMHSALVRKGYRATAIDAGRDLPEVLRREEIEVAVIALHGPWGEDGVVQGLLEVMGIPYTGSGVLASALCMDKTLAKRLLRDGGLPTPPWWEVNVTHPDQLNRMVEALPPGELPLFIKPVGSGSSVGVARAATPEELAPALAAAAAVSPRVLIEKEAKGTEITLSVLDGEPLPLVEVRPLSGFYDYVNKYTSGRTQYLCPPPDLSTTAVDRAVETGLAAYRLAGCRGLARVDMIVDDRDQPWVLELNTIPGMTELSLAPQAARAAGMSFDDLVERILNGAARPACDASS